MTDKNYLRLLLKEVFIGTIYPKEKEILVEAYQTSVEYIDHDIEMIRRMGFSETIFD